MLRIAKIPDLRDAEKIDVGIGLFEVVMGFTRSVLY